MLLFKTIYSCSLTFAWLLKLIIKKQFFLKKGASGSLEKNIIANLK